MHSIDGIMSGMFETTEPLIWGILLGLFLAEQLRVLHGNQILLHQTWTGSWKACPTILANSVVRIVFLPLRPTSRVVAGTELSASAAFDAAESWDQLPEPREVHDVLAFVRDWGREGRGVAWAASGLAVSLMVVLLLGQGILSLPIPFAPRWGWGAMLCCWCATIALYRRAGNSLDARGHSPAPGQGVEMLISPLAAIKAFTVLGAGGMKPLSPAAVTWALAPPTDLDPHVRRLCGATLLVADNNPRILAQDSPSFERLKALLQLRGADLSQVLAAPPPDPDARCYCPHCHGQFTRQFTVCPICSQVECRGFGSPDDASTATRLVEASSGGFGSIPPHRLPT